MIGRFHTEAKDGMMSSLEFPQHQAFVIVWQASEVRMMVHDEAAANPVPCGVDSLFLLHYTERGWQPEARDQDDLKSYARELSSAFSFPLFVWRCNGMSSNRSGRACSTAATDLGGALNSATRCALPRLETNAKMLLNMQFPCSATRALRITLQSSGSAMSRFLHWLQSS